MPYVQKVWVDNVDKVDAQNMNHMEGGVGTAVATSEAALVEALKPGPAGPTGPQGIKGDTGSQGPQGVQGNTGNTGAQGPQGVQGQTGPQGTGLFIRGTVPTSSALPVTPVTVDDAWVAVDTGHVWFWDETNLPSPRWEDGGALQGAPGATGPQGPTGATGSAGAPGATGSQGPPGAAGSNGATGPAGPGVPVGGTIGQSLVKTGSADYATGWGASAGGSSLTYEGAYVPATAYQDGDIVVLNGVAYICHRDTSTPPDPALWGAVGISLPPTIPPDGFGVALPASPVDGQTFTLVDSLTNPQYQWRFRYVAGSASAYKWIFIGGAPAFVAVAANETSVSTTMADLTTVGPSFTVPVAGDYEIKVGANGGASPANGTGWMSVAVGATAADANDGIIFIISAAGGQFGQERTMVKSAVPAATVLRAKYQVSGGATVNYMNRRLFVTPLRVG